MATGETNVSIGSTKAKTEY